MDILNNLPKIYATCRAGCQWETIHRDEFANAATYTPVYPTEGGAFQLEVGKEYKIFADERGSGAWMGIITVGDYSLGIIKKADKYANSYTFRVLEFAADHLVYEIDGVRYEDYPEDTTINGDYIEALGVNKVFVFNADASIVGLKGDKGDKGDKGEGVEKYFTVEKSINLFDKSQPRESGLIMGNGQIISQEGIEIATIPVEVGKTYTYPIYYSHFGYNAAYNVACYDKDMVYLGWITGIPSADNALLTVTIGTTVYSYTTYAEVEAEVAFVKVNISPNIYVDINTDTFMFVEGAEYPDTYHAYFADKIILNPSVEVKNAESDDVLRGKTIVFTGDSICAGTSDESGVCGWAQRIGEKHSMNWQNKGINGATITSGVTGSSGCIADTDFGETPDYIILEGGTNDADLIGSADNFTPEKFGSYTLGQYNAEFDKTTFCGAVEHLFKRVTTDYAGAKIGFIIAHKMGYATTAAHYDAATSRRRKYFETIIELCKKWGIPYIDLWEGCYLCPMNPAHNTANTNLMYVGDYQHLAKKGYDYITPMIEKWMETL